MRRVIDFFPGEKVRVKTSWRSYGHGTIVGVAANGRTVLVELATGLREVPLKNIFKVQA